MAEVWHDINTPGFFGSKKPIQQASAEEDVTFDTSATMESSGPEVRLSDPQWAEGPDGFAFNKKVGASVKVEYLKQTMRKRVNFELFVESDEGREDLKAPVAGYEKDGRAAVELPLYYGDKYYSSLRDNPAATCNYIFKATHSTGEQPLESVPLEMPHTETISVTFAEIADIHFHHNCALPCLDESGNLMAILTSAFSYASENPDRELIVLGHADKSGDESYNFTISKRRAEAVKALLDNDANLWKGVVASDKTDQTIETEDYQQTLKSLAVKYGWPCDVGTVDNQYGPKTNEGVRGFQLEYNKRFTNNEQLEDDGAVGPKTWLAIFYTLRDQLERALTSAELDPPPSFTYGYPDGKGVYPCGESCPVSGVEKSEEDRRVELVFYEKSDWAPAITPAPGRRIVS